MAWDWDRKQAAEARKATNRLTEGERLLMISILCLVVLGGFIRYHRSQVPAPGSVEQTTTQSPLAAEETRNASRQRND